MSWLHYAGPEETGAWGAAGAHQQTLNPFLGHRAVEISDDDFRMQEKKSKRIQGCNVNVMQGP